MPPQPSTVSKVLGVVKYGEPDAPFPMRNLDHRGNC